MTKIEEIHCPCGEVFGGDKGTDVVCGGKCAVCGVDAVRAFVDHVIGVCDGASGPVGELAQTARAMVIRMKAAATAAQPAIPPAAGYVVRWGACADFHETEGARDAALLEASDAGFFAEWFAVVKRSDLRAPATGATGG
jgi:hypothetical protein